MKNVGRSPDTRRLLSHDGQDSTAQRRRLLAQSFGRDPAAFAPAISPRPSVRAGAVREVEDKPDQLLVCIKLAPLGINAVQFPH